MNKTIEATKKQILRGHILILCNELQTMGAGVPLMHMVLQKQGASYTQKDISEACHYLHDKQLINFKHFQSDELNAKRDIAYITSAGIDVLEGTTPMAGVVVG